MKTIKVLSWFADNYLRGVLKRVEDRANIRYRDLSDFDLKGTYSSNLQQDDFDTVLREYMPDIIILVDRTSRNLSVDIPEDIRILIFCDHFHEQFCIFGKTFYDWLPKNNYLLYPILDIHNLDRDKVLENAKLKGKMFLVPFMPYMEEMIEEKGDEDIYTCDISVMLRYKRINYYYGCYGINLSTFPGKMLVQFLGELVRSVRDLLKQGETAYIEDENMRQLITVIADRLHLVQYVRDYDRFLEYWFNEVKFNIVPTEYSNRIVEWLIEGGYNIRVYGAGWECDSKFKQYAFGEVTDGSGELRKAYRYSKISIGTGANMGLHRRVFEAMENNCLCLQAEICKDMMFSDWRHYFEDGKDIVIFHDKQELYQKLDYFLVHEEERMRLIRAARERLKVCPDLTKLMEDVILEVYRK